MGWIPVLDREIRASGTFLISRPAESNTSAMADLIRLESTQVAFGLSANSEKHSIAHRRPLPRRVNQCQYPRRLAIHLVDQAVVLMGDQLQRAGGYPLSADPWMIHQLGRRLAELLVHPGGRLWIISGDVVPDVEAILQRLGRPYDPHDW